MKLAAIQMSSPLLTQHPSLGWYSIFFLLLYVSSLFGHVMNTLFFFQEIFESERSKTARQRNLLKQRIFFKLEGNHFTISCLFLLYNMNPPYVYIHPLPLEPPAHPSVALLQVITECCYKLPVLTAASHEPSIFHMVMGMCQRCSLDSTLSFPYCVCKSLLYVCSANRLISTIFLDSIYMC